MAQGRSFPNDDRQRVLDATDIVRLVGDHVQLKQKGREFLCVCPFHDDHKPSMYVVPAKQIYHCFSCGAGGNALDFAINYFKMDFREALKFLADRAGLELTPWKPQHTSNSGAHESGHSDEHGGRSSRAQLFDAAAFAHDFFRTILRHPEHGKTARETVQKRAIAPEMVDEFALGASPDRWDGLERTIASKKLDPAPFLALGLLKKREREAPGGGSYDALRHRLIFPIHDQIGRVIGFGGRKMRDEDEPKYLNSPESPLFDKGKNLYGLHLARKAIQDSKTAIVTEGYTDVIACHQRGVRNVVATLGTALTREHARILERMCDTVVLLFDADEAGQRAADRAIEVFFTSQVDVKICVLPDGKDPDELLKQTGGSDRFLKALATPPAAIDFQFARIMERAGVQRGFVSPQFLEDYIRRLIDLGLGSLPPVKQIQVAQQLAKLTGLLRQTVLQFVERHSRVRIKPTTYNPSAAKPAPQREAHRIDPKPDSLTLPPPSDEIRERRVRRMAEKMLLGAFLEAPSLLGEATLCTFENDEHLEREFRASDILDTRCRRLFETILELSQEVDANRILSSIDPAELRVYATALHADFLRLSEADSLTIRRMFYDCLKTISHTIMTEQARRIRHENALNENDSSWLEAVFARRRAIDPNRHMLRTDPEIQTRTTSTSTSFNSDNSTSAAG